MSKIIYIKANAKPAAESRTFRISDAFVHEYTTLHPNDEIITLDLYKEGISFLSEEGIRMHRPQPGEGMDHPVLKYAYQFAQADKFIIAAPLWNLGIPAILKAYIDYICITGITFKYSEQGPVGLCQGKKAVHIVSRGGDYSHPPFSDYEMGDKYLRTILGFLGITDFNTIAADALDYWGSDVEQILGQAEQKAIEAARLF